MKLNNETIYTTDLANKKLKVERQFNAPLDKVWRAWTESELLDQWWAPKPWKANTKSMDFRPDGFWLYYMQGPDGSKHYCRVDYQSVTLQKSYSSQNSFCDEDGKLTNTAPSMHWQNDFTAEDNTTKVNIEISFATEADLKTIVEMGFKEGFEAGHKNLDELLAR